MKFINDKCQNMGTKLIHFKVKAGGSATFDYQAFNSRAAVAVTVGDGRGDGLQSNPHEFALFERSEFANECAEQLIEYHNLCTAARRSRGLGA